MKWMVYAAIALSVLPALAHQKHQLTDQQKQCLSSILGEPGQSERPTHEAMNSAFQQCQVSASENSRPPGPPPDLSDEQISCLENKLGKPGDGEPPTEEAFKQAHSDCGITVPEKNSENQ